MSKDLIKSSWLDAHQPEVKPAVSPQAYHVEANYNWNPPHKRYKVKSQVLNLTYSAGGLHLLAISEEKQVYLWRIEDGQVLQTMRLEGRGKLNVVAYSPVRQVIAGASDEEMMIRVWDAKTGRLRYSLRGHTTPIKKLTFSPNGQVLLSAGGEDGTLRYWQVENGQLLRISKHDSSVLNVAYRPDGQILATKNGDWNYISLWDVQTDKRIKQLGTANSSRDLAWRQDGKLIASNDNKSLCIWRTNQAKRFKMFKGHSQTITQIVWSPNGEQIATGSEDKSIRVWSLNEPVLRHVCTGHDKAITALAYSPNGQTLASASEDNTVRIWQLATAKKKEAEVAITSPALIAYTPTPASHAAPSLFGGWFNGAPPQIRAVQPEPMSDERSLPHIICAGDVKIMHLAYHIDGKTLIGATHDGHLYQWRISDGELVYSLAPVKRTTWNVFALCPTGNSFATAENMLIRIWDLTGDLRYTLRGHSSHITSLDYDILGTSLASAGGQDQTIRVWQTNNGELKHILTSDIATNHLTFDSIGRSLATANDDKDIHIWDISKEKDKLKLKIGSEIDHLVWQPNISTILASTNGEIQAWDAKGKLLQRFQGHSSLSTICLAWSHDGQTFISGSGSDHTVRIWSLKQKDPLHICQGHHGGILTVASSRDGRTIASAGKDGKLRIWRLTDSP